MGHVITDIAGLYMIEKKKIKLSHIPIPTAQTRILTLVSLFFSLIAVFHYNHFFFLTIVFNLGFFHSLALCMVVSRTFAKSGSIFAQHNCSSFIFQSCFAFFLEIHRTDLLSSRLAALPEKWCLFVALLTSVLHHYNDPAEGEF